jgi:hypothetical protein
LPFVLDKISDQLAPLLNHFSALHLSAPRFIAADASLIGASVALAWLLNLAIKVVRLKRSAVFEEQASYSLLRTREMLPLLIAAFASVAFAAALMLTGHFLLALASATVGVLLSRYLFFVSVVPLNMALTYVRRQAA